MANAEQNNQSYRKTLEWIKESLLDEDILDNYYKEFFPGGTIDIQPAKGINPPEWGKTRTFNNAFSAVIQNGSIWRSGDWHFILTPNKKLLSDLSFPFYWHGQNYDSSQVTPITHNTKAAAALAGSPANNYYHWLFDYLPRIYLFQLSGFSFDHYITPKLTKSFQYETLSLLGIPMDKIIQIDKNPFHLKAEKLVVASIPHNLGSAPKWTVDFIRNRFLNQSKKKDQEYERIYVSREDARRRKVINEDEIMSVLSKKGFKKVTLGSLSVQEQVNIFSSANFIISAHGAQLTNLAFCEPGTKVIELYTATTDCFWKMSSYLGLDFYYLKCPEKNPDTPNNKKILENITIDVKELVNLLTSVED